MNDLTLIYQSTLIKSIRAFFNERDFADVLVPLMVQNPGMEPHIHPMKVTGAIDNKFKGYLHTSPEFFMKKILSYKHPELRNIFTLNYCYRDEPKSTHHRNQFLMLEWYRTDSHYFKIMDDLKDLIIYCSKSFKNKFTAKSFTRMSIQELFIKELNIDILDYLDPKKLRTLIEKEFQDVPLPKQDLAWDDYYFLLFLNKLEPKLEKYPAIILYEFPAPLSALSTIKESDPRVCERFEVYCNGIEIANCYNELTDHDEQKKRFNEQAKLKSELYSYELPDPSEFYESMQRGLPKSSGIALGVERLLMVLSDIENSFQS
jgi:elongation factor P--(R)-beta-lysine ligase